MTFGTFYLSSALPDFAALHPALNLDLDLDDRVVDLVHGSYDLAVRIGRLPDSSLVARAIAPNRHVLVASFAYLARHGAPGGPEELKDCDCLLYSNRDHAPTWALACGDEMRSFRVRPKLRSNKGDVFRDAAVAGFGIALLPTVIVGLALAQGTLQVVLAGHAPPDNAISAVYPASRHLPSKVRVFIDFLRDRFGPMPPWEVALDEGSRPRAQADTAPT